MNETSVKKKQINGYVSVAYFRAVFIWRFYQQEGQSIGLKVEGC